MSLVVVVGLIAGGAIVFVSLGVIWKRKEATKELLMCLVVGLLFTGLSVYTDIGVKIGAYEIQLRATLDEVTRVTDQTVLVAQEVQRTRELVRRVAATNTATQSVATEVRTQPPLFNVDSLTAARNRLERMQPSAKTKAMTTYSRPNVP